MSDQNSSSQPSVNETDNSVTGPLPLIIGRLITLFVHEANNHLATLSESAGLGDDIISANNLSDKEKLKELKKLLDAMDDRTGHAASLVRTFGELGRHMENPAGSIDINKAIEGVMPFLSKIGRQKNLKIRTSYDNKLPAAAGDFCRLQCLILALFDNFSAALEPSATATITTKKAISKVGIHLTADCFATADSDQQPWSWKTLETFASANSFEVIRQQGGAVSILIKNKE